MAIHYGFYSHAPNYREANPGVAKAAEAKYRQLTPAQETLYHDVLPLVLNAVGIPFVSEDTEPYIMARLQILGNPYPSLDLKPFYMYSTNCWYESDRDFLRRVTCRAAYPKATHSRHATAFAAAVRAAGAAGAA